MLSYAQRHECLFLALGLDHHVGFSVPEGIHQYLSIRKVHIVGVSTSSLLRVLTGEVELRRRPSILPRR